MAPEVRGGRRLTLAAYVRRRNGVPLGAPGSLGNMLRRAFGAPTFAGFWQHWNPIFGYGLGRWVHAPARRLMPDDAALVLTFVVCGAGHDLVTAAVRGAPALLFTLWFAFMGTAVVVGRRAGLDWGHRPFAVRATIHAAIVAGCLGAVFALGLAVL